MSKLRTNPDPLGGGGVGGVAGAEVGAELGTEVGGGAAGGVDLWVGTGGVAGIGPIGAVSDRGAGTRGSVNLSGLETCATAPETAWVEGGVDGGMTAANCVENSICAGAGKVSEFGSAFNTDRAPEKMMASPIRNRIKHPFHNPFIFFMLNELLSPMC